MVWRRAYFIRLTCSVTVQPLTTKAKRHRIHVFDKWSIYMKKPKKRVFRTQIWNITLCFFFDNSKGLSVPSSTTMSLAPEALQVWSFEIMGLLAISKNLGFREANTEEGDPGILKSQFHEMFGHPLRCICWTPKYKLIQGWQKRSCSYYFILLRGGCQSA